jgi:signal transduction histidine kinase
MRQISQEIHDNVGQILSLVNLNLNTMSVYDSNKINNTSELVNKAITDLRNLSKSLNPESIAKQGLIQLLRNELHQLEASGKYKTFLVVEDEIALPSNRLIILYRIIQEVISNIIRHSNATEVKAAVSKNSLCIADNGKGFTTSLESAGLGLHNLKQRANAIGGTLDVETSEGKGTIVTFNLY